MIVSFAADGSVELLDADDFGSFSAAGQRPAADAELPHGIVLSPDGSHAFVPPDALVVLAGGDVASDWTDRLDAMVTYAASKGWLDDHGRIQAHTTWS